MSAVPQPQFQPKVEYQTSSWDLARAVARLVLILVWTFGCYFALRCVCAAAFFIKSAVSVKKRVARRWVAGMARLLGMRIKVAGSLPQHPYFMVGNHMSWLDLFVGMSVAEGRPITEDPLRKLPIVGPLIAGFNPIYVRRVKQDTPRVKQLMVDALRRGDSLLLAPETPDTPFPLGQGVRMFRAGLIGAAIEAGRPVHYLSLTYRTPPGYPPASKVLMFGPNPFYRDANGNIPESELAAFGGRHSFLRHVIGVLALPWHEITVTFGKRPITAPDPISLANALHRAVSGIFTPVV